MAVLKIGWAETDITPDKKIFLAGQFAERISEYVEKPLTATAMAAECGEDQMVICSCDLSGISNNLLEAVREKLQGNTDGLDPEKVILCAIHTHTGPNYTKQSKRAKIAGKATKTSDLLKAMLPPDRKYIDRVNMERADVAGPKEVLELLVERLPEVILRAWKARKPASYINEFGRAAVGMCRRAVFSDGSAAMWGDTDTALFEELEGGNDSGMELLYLLDEKNDLTGVVINLACPAQCVQHRLFVSPDFWGEVKVLLRERFGKDLFMLPLCSAAGDQCPVDLVRFVEPESELNDPNIDREHPKKRKADPSMFDLAGMKRAGKRIAREVIDRVEEGLPEAVTDTDLVHHIRHMQLPLRRVTKAEVEAAKEGIRTYMDRHPGDVNYVDAAKLQKHLGVLARAELQEKMEVLDTECHFVKLGNIAFATSPFELFLDYGNKIKARSRAEQTFLIQLCCGSEGYLPTEKAERGGHYSAFVSSGAIGHTGGDQLVRETLSEINGSLFGTN